MAGSRDRKNHSPKEIEWAPLPDKKYSIIYIDPPWQYDCVMHSGSSFIDDKGKKTIRYNAAHIQYPTASIPEMKKLDIESIAEKDCLMFMWMVGPMIPEAIELGAHWGFKFITFGFIWHKERVNPGYYTCSSVEYVGIFKRGSIPTPRGSRCEYQFLSQISGEHSRKPIEIMRRIERMFPEQSKIEIFARMQHEGWDAYGNETEKYESKKLF